MNHTSDQDLLLLAHNSLGLVKTALARFHVWRCVACRRRLTEFDSFSRGVAAAVRGVVCVWCYLQFAV